MESCATGFDLVDDSFCSSHCSNYYNNECYSCDEGYYRVVKTTGSTLAYSCLSKDNCIANGLKLIGSLKECYEVCPSTTYSLSDANECIICSPNCASFANN